MFQYAENKEDLKEIGSDTLVIMGEGTPIVGVNYHCQHYIARNSKKDKSLTSTSDFTERKGGYNPPAKNKRDRRSFDPNEYYSQPEESNWAKVTPEDPLEYVFKTIRKKPMPPDDAIEPPKLV